MAQEYLLQMEGINKSFHGVSVLKNAQLHIRPGEVHALMGENGAGKSTLMKILMGIYTKDSGDIIFEGVKQEHYSQAKAKENGITMMHQEISLVPQLSIAENIFLGCEKKKNGVLDKKCMNEKTQAVLDELKLGLKAVTRVEKLSIAQQQMVEIAKALAFNSKLIIMDEPTAALSEKEADSLLEEILKLKTRGVSVIYISHRMKEIFRISDRITVLRDGGFVGEVERKQVANERLIAMMVGREISDIFGAREHIAGSDKIILEVRHFVNKMLKDVSFQLRQGEILGFAGLVGAGRSELSRAIFGIDPLTSGELYLNGEKTNIKTARAAIARGMTLLPEDRKAVGLIQSNTVAFNLTLPVVDRFIRHLRVDRKKEQAIVDEYAHKLSIKMSSPKQICNSLSGGNQQKVVLSKCLVSQPKILILDEPTRGIDVGTKLEIYQLIRTLAKEGISIIMISSELPEILNLSSRIAVMHEGELITILENDSSVTQETIMHYATGGH